MVRVGTAAANRGLEPGVIAGLDLARRTYSSAADGASRSAAIPIGVRAKSRKILRLARPRRSFDRTAGCDGTSDDERAQIIKNLREVEPLLRRRATMVLDTSGLAVPQVVDRILELASGEDLM